LLLEQKVTTIFEFAVNIWKMKMKTVTLNLVTLFILIIGIITSSSVANRKQIQCKSYARADINDVVPNFKEICKGRFIGQEDAFDTTINAIRKFKPEQDLLLLHFIGAAGTGKTYFVDLVRRAFFKLRQCAPLASENVGMIRSMESHLLCPVYEKLNFRQQQRVKLDDACGVAYEEFQRFDLDDHAGKRLALERALEKAFSTREDPLSTVILVLENFNHCKESCEKLMTSVMTSRKHRLRDNTDISLVNTIILVTSDLSFDGLRLLPEDTKEEALRRALDASKTVWGADSLWNDFAHIVPLIPYSDNELVKILELVIQDAQEEISDMIEAELKRTKQQLNIKFGEVRWTGRFVFTDAAKTKLVNQLYFEILQKNARAFDKIRAKLKAATKRPEFIEDRLLRYRPTETDTNVPELARKVVSVFSTTATFRNREYTQNIVFKVVDDDRMIVLEIVDLDGYEPNKSSDSRSDEL
jgi:hypothetical protein